MPRRGKGACRGRTPSRIPSRSRQTPKRRGRPPTARVPRAAGASKTDVCLRQRGEVLKKLAHLSRSRFLDCGGAQDDSCVVEQADTAPSRKSASHARCYGVPKFRGARRAPTRWLRRRDFPRWRRARRYTGRPRRRDRRARAPAGQRRCRGPPPRVGGTGARFSRRGAGARRTHALALARRERGRETTGEPSAHALPRRTRACHSHGGHAHSHSHGEHSHSHGDERRFVTGEKDVSPSPGDDAASWPPRGTRLHTELVRAPYAFRRNPPLARGAGRGLCLFVDAFTAGIAGDMFVAAALDLGVPLGAVREQLAALSETPSPAGSPSPSQSPSFGGYAIDVVHDEKSCIVAPRFVVAEDGGRPAADARLRRDQCPRRASGCAGRARARARAAVLLCSPRARRRCTGWTWRKYTSTRSGRWTAWLISLRRARRWSTWTAPACRSRRCRWARASCAARRTGAARRRRRRC